MKIYKHVTANFIKLEPFDFKRELSMEDYLIENSAILSHDNDDFSSPNIICDELPIRNGRKAKDRDGRIDLLVKFEGAETLAVIELKNGEIGFDLLEQLSDYLSERNQIYIELLENEDFKRNVSEILEPKWMGILVGTSISQDLINMISEGIGLDVGGGEFLLLAALTVKRFKSDDNHYFVVTDTYFNSKKFSKDLSKYNFNNKTYGKGRLVLAIAKDYVEKNPSVTFSELKKVFPDNLQGSGGVFVSKSDALSVNENGRMRYFTKESELIELEDEIIAISNQWGIRNIEKFLSKIKKIGYEIK